MPDAKRKINYGQLLLALGNYIEEKGWRDICVLEVEGGVIIQGTNWVPTTEGYQYTMETKLFTHDELVKMTASKK
jgi:hypothetical protein